MIDCNVKKTGTGLLTRYDDDIGLFVFSPYTGLVYGMNETCNENIKQWMEGNTKVVVPEVYKKTIGLGWDVSLDDAEFIKPHLLPNKDSWNNTDIPTRPMMINWLLTGICNHNCVYCYAQDLMHEYVKEPNEQDIDKIAHSILSYNPLAVVLTGGDPLNSPYLFRAIKLLSGKTGIIIDTNAFLFTDEHLKFFKEHNVVVRISLDSQRPSIHHKQRPLKSDCKNNKIFFAIDALCNCLDNSIPVVVQTVATSQNANELIEFGDKLYKLGVKVWRILMLQPSSLKMDGYNKFIGTKTQKKKLYEYTFKRLEARYKSEWHQHMSLQISRNALQDTNYVILVSPEGKFYTESIIGSGKVLLDEKNPTCPDTNAIAKKVNFSAHFFRYLNL